MQRKSVLTKIAYVGAGLVAGGVLAGTVGAQAATSSPTPATTSSSTAATADPHPGDNGADGVPESQEVHGGRGGHRGYLGISGTVTAVGASSVTIKTSTATTAYTVTSASDIDKNGESTLSKLVVGDKVRFSVDSSNAKQIDKLHAGDETTNMPTGTANPGSSTSAN